MTDSVQAVAVSWIFHGALLFSLGTYVLDSLGDIDQKVGSVGVWAEAPDLSAVIDVPLVFLGKVSGSGLDVITGSDLLVFNLVRKTVREGEGFHVETVVLKYD